MTPPGVDILFKTDWFVKDRQEGAVRGSRQALVGAEVNWDGILGEAKKGRRPYLALSLALIKERFG